MLISDVYHYIYIYTHIHTHIYIHIFFFIFFSIMVYHRILNKFPMLYGRTLLFTHPVYNGLHLLTPNSQSIPS